MANVTRLKAALRAHRLDPGLGIEQIRGQMAADAAALSSLEGIDVEPVNIGGVPAESITPAVGEHGPVSRTVLYLHGGGYCAGSIGAVQALAGRIALGASARVVTLDYRLAPEHPFPAGRDDVLAAYRSLLGSGTDPAPLAIGGDSAGGGLTISALVALRDAGDPLPAAGFCLSPWVDLRLTSKSVLGNADADPIISPALLERFADWYLGAGANRDDADVSPVLAELRGLPRLLVQVGQDECVVDDATLLAERAKAAGVIVDLEVWPDVFHVWHLLAPRFDPANHAVSRLANWLVDVAGAQ